MLKYRSWLFIALSLFAAAIIFGLVAPASVPRLLFREITDLTELGRTLTSLPPLIVAITIFIRNALALSLSFLLSPILCLLPIIALIVNGSLLGWASAIAIQKESVGFLLAGVLPHGLVEIPAFIIGEAAALSFGSLVILYLLKKDVRSRLLPRLKKDLKYLVTALILLIPAAFIEAFVTPMLLK